MKRASLSFIFIMGVFLTLGACKEGSVSGIGGGGTGGTGTGGDGGATGGNGGTGGLCPGERMGDEAKWAEVTAGPFTCQKNSDCCVVFNGCLAQAQIVKAADFTTAPAAWPYCSDLCVACISPAVNVACVQGLCVGEEIDWSSEPPTELMQDHCGEDPVVVGTPAAVTRFGCVD